MGKVVGIDYEIARQFGANAALVHNELLFWGNKKSARKDGWIYKTYEEMTERLPLSEQTIRRAYKKLESAGIIATKIMRLDGTPVLHYKMLVSETTKLAESKETTKLAESLINTVTNTVTSHDTQNSETSNIAFGADSGAVNEPAAESPADKNLRLMEYIISVINPREKVTEGRMRNLRARLKDYTHKEIALAAQAFSQSEWHKTHKQMSVDNLIRESKFGRWYAEIEVATDGEALTREERYQAEREKFHKEQEEQMKRNQEFIDQGL